MAMKVALTPEQEKVVSDKISSGRYQTASEVVGEALQLLQQRDTLRKELQIGLDQIERGEFREHNEKTLRRLASQVKARGIARLKRRSRNRSS